MRTWEKVLGALASIMAVCGGLASVGGATNFGIVAILAVCLVGLIFVAQILRLVREQKRQTELLRESSRLARDLARDAYEGSTATKREVIAHSHRIRSLLKDQFQMIYRRDSTQFAQITTSIGRAADEAQDAAVALSDEVASRSKQVRTQVVGERRTVIESLSKTEVSMEKSIRALLSELRRDRQVSLQKVVAQIDGLRNVADSIEGKLESGIDHGRTLANQLQALSDEFDAAEVSHSFALLERELRSGHSLVAGLATTLEDKVTSDTIEDFRQCVSRVEAAAASIRADSGSTRSELGAIGTTLSADVEKVFDRLDSGLDHIASRQVKESNRLVVAMRSETQETEALLQLYANFYPRWVMPSLGRWALDARSALHLRQLVEDRKPKRIVEFGGGSSTVWLAYLCERIGAELTSIDHHPEFHQRTCEALERHQLSHVVESRLGELERYELNGETYSWYARASYEDLEDVELLFVDGPPSTTGAMARFPALPLVYRSLSAEALVLLDDSDRADEVATIQEWHSMYPEISRVQQGVSRLAVLNLGDDSD